MGAFSSYPCVCKSFHNIGRVDLYRMERFTIRREMQSDCLLICMSASDESDLSPPGPVRSGSGHGPGRGGWRDNSILFHQSNQEHLQAVREPSSGVPTRKGAQ